MEKGTHDGISPRHYHKWSFDVEKPEKGPISCSLLKRYASLGPLGFRCAPQKPQSKAMSWGSLVDCLAFTPELFPREFVVKESCPDLSADGGFRSKAAKEWREEQIANGASIITEEETADAETAVQRLLDTPASAEILDGGRYQVALIGETAGVPMKALLDVVPAHFDHDNCLADLKTTAVNLYDDDALRRQAGQYKYHWQAAFYLQIWNNLNPDDKRRKFKIVWQSSSAPYEVRVTELDDLFLEAGKAAISGWLPRLIADIKSRAFQSAWRTKETILSPHNPTIYAEELQMEVLEARDGKHDTGPGQKSVDPAHQEAEGAA